MRGWDTSALSLRGCVAEPGGLVGVRFRWKRKALRTARAGLPLTSLTLASLLSELPIIFL